MSEPRNRNLVERALLESIISVAGRMLARNFKRGAQVRHALIIGFSDEPGFTLDGRTVLENCTFMRWNLLSEDTRIRLVAENVVQGSADKPILAGAVTREAALDSLAFKLATRAWPPKRSLWKQLELDAERRRREWAEAQAFDRHEFDDEDEDDLDEVEPADG